MIILLSIIIIIIILRTTSDTAKGEGYYVCLHALSHKDVAAKGFALSGSNNAIFLNVLRELFRGSQNGSEIFLICFLEFSYE